MATRFSLYLGVPLRRIAGASVAGCLLCVTFTYAGPAPTRSADPMSSARALLRSKHSAEVPSPDGKFRARLTYGEAEAIELEVVAGPRSAREVRLRDIVNLCWLRGEPHTLLVATSGLYGTAGIFRWLGGSKPTYLRRARRPADEVFKLLSVDGKTRVVRYRHWRSSDTNTPFSIEKLVIAPNAVRK